jgi:steroid delta-isomerase-like uncharacterized protein
MSSTETQSAQEQVVEHWGQHWTAHNVDALLSLHTDDAVLEDVARGMTFRGKEQLRAYAEAFFTGYPDVSFELTSRFAAGNHGGAEWIMRGTHLGDRPGLPATGKPVEIRGVSIFDFSEGKIRRCSEYWDMATMLKQLGLPAARS